MNESNSIEERINIYCPVCGTPWTPGVDPETGKPYDGHPADTICARHRPKEVPAWLTAAVRAKADDGAKARGELLGTVTTEWAARNGHAEKGAKANG